MAMKRGRPGSPSVAHASYVGPSTGENFTNPVNMGIDREYEEGYDKKTLCSPSANTITGAGLPLHDNYNSLFEGK